MPAAHLMHLYFDKIHLVGRHISGVRVRWSREGMKYCFLSSRLAIIRHIGRLVDEMIVCIDENQEACEQQRHNVCRNQQDCLQTASDKEDRHRAYMSQSTLYQYGRESSSPIGTY